MNAGNFGYNKVLLCTDLQVVGDMGVVYIRYGTDLVERQR